MANRCFKQVLAGMMIGGVFYVGLRPPFDHDERDPATVPPDHHHVPEETPAAQEWFGLQGTISGITATPPPGPYYGFSGFKG